MFGVLNGIAVFVALTVFGFSTLLSIAAYWLLRNMETAFIATANSTAHAGDFTGYAQTVTYWPNVAWLIMLFGIGIAVFIIGKFGRSTNA